MNGILNALLYQHGYICQANIERRDLLQGVYRPTICCPIEKEDLGFSTKLSIMSRELGLESRTSPEVLSVVQSFVPINHSLKHRFVAEIPLELAKKIRPPFSSGGFRPISQTMLSEVREVPAHSHIPPNPNFIPVLAGEDRVRFLQAGFETLLYAPTATEC